MSSIIKVDTIQDQDGNNIINENADVITVGASGDTITIPAGATFDSSAATNTLPATVVTTTGTQTLTNKSIATTQLTGTITPSDSTVSLAKLTATGTKNSTTFLRGDNTFDTPPLGGITMAQQWRLTTSFTGNADPIASNLEKADSGTQGSIGSDMTESSGVFTFPSTGIYKIEYQMNVASNGNATQHFAPYIMTTANNSTFGTAAQAYGNIPASGYYNSSYSVFIFDCVDTSTHKVRFGIAFQNTSCQVMGDTGKQLTGFTFTRLGDT